MVGFGQGQVAMVAFLVPGQVSVPAERAEDSPPPRASRRGAFRRWPWTFPDGKLAAAYAQLGASLQEGWSPLTRC